MKTQHNHRNGATSTANSARLARRTNGAAARAVEMLESRTLMSGSVADISAITPPVHINFPYTTVKGTAGNDVIDIDPDIFHPGYVCVLVNGKMQLDEKWSSMFMNDLIVDGNGGTDTINVGFGDLSSFTGNLQIQDTGGKATININDSADNANRTITQLSEYNDDIITGLAPGSISFTESQTTVLNLKVGNGADIVHAGGGSQNITVGNGNDFLYGGSGPDTLTSGTGADTFVTIGDGPAQLNGGGGFNTYWTDTGTSQKISDPYEGWEKLFGNIHTVSGYQKLVVDYVHGGTASQTPPLGAVGSLLEPDSTNSSPGPTYAYANFSNDPLFSPGGPTQNDIRQGGIGDCGFMSGLAGIAKTDAHFIEQSIVPLGDGTYCVRFYKSGAPVYYRIDAELPVYSGTSLVGAQTGADNCIWVALFEKAFAFARLGEGTYQSIQGGGCVTAFNIFGAAYTNVWGSSATNVLNNIEAELTAGDVVEAGSVTTPTSSDYVVGDHCYLVESVQYSGGVPVSITLRNPWGYDGPNIKDNPSAYGTLSAAQFYRDFWGTSAALV